MVCRVLKNVYFARLREAQLVDDRALRRVTVAFLNDVFARDAASVAYWEKHIYPSLQVDYQYDFYYCDMCLLSDPSLLSAVDPFIANEA